MDVGSCVNVAKHVDDLFLRFYGRRGTLVNNSCTLPVTEAFLHHKVCFENPVAQKNGESDSYGTHKGFSELDLQFCGSNVLK